MSSTDILRIFLNREKCFLNRGPVKAWFWKYKGTLACSVCGEKHPSVIEFHHTNADKKDSTVANMVKRGLPIFRIKKEIRKCIVLCANCHRKHHYNIHSGDSL
jgi:transcription elongation factor Elf1